MVGALNFVLAVGQKWGKCTSSLLEDSALLWNMVLYWSDTVRMYTGIDSFMCPLHCIGVNILRSITEWGGLSWGPRRARCHLLERRVIKKKRLDYNLHNTHIIVSQQHSCLYTVYIMSLWLAHVSAQDISCHGNGYTALALMEFAFDVRGVLPNVVTRILSNRLSHLGKGL